MTFDGVCLVFQRGETFLLGKRAPHKKASEYWCPVSGTVEEGETQEEAIVREAREELDVLARPVRKLAEMLTNDGSFLLHWWLVELAHGEPRLANDEHTEIGWFTYEEMTHLEPIFHEDLFVYKNLTQGKD